MACIVAIIPARGGSKGLPGKNIREFCGKPLIAWTIEAAKSVNCINHVVVTTDDDAIADISKKYGAEVPFMRPTHLATDESKVFDAIAYTLQRYSEEKKLKIDMLVILQPTSPLRTNEHIEEAIKLYSNNNSSSLISVTKTDHPVQWEMVIDENGYLENYFQNKELTNRQSYKSTYHPNGMIYIYNYQEYIEKKGHGFENVVPYVIRKEYSVDIDDVFDFEYAEYIQKKINNIER